MLKKQTILSQSDTESICLYKVFLNFSELSATVLDYHSGAYGCTEEKLVVQYGNQAQQFCSDQFDGGHKINAGVNKIALTFTTPGTEDGGGFWLKYQGTATLSTVTHTLKMLNDHGYS